MVRGHPYPLKSPASALITRRFWPSYSMRSALALFADVRQQSPDWQYPNETSPERYCQARSVDTVKGSGKADYRIADGGRLYLLVRPNGSKLWRHAACSMGSSWSRSWPSQFA